MIEMAVENIKAVVAHFRLDNGIGFVSNSIGPYSIPENRVTRAILDFVDSIFTKHLIDNQVMRPPKNKRLILITIILEKENMSFYQLTILWTASN